VPVIAFVPEGQVGVGHTEGSGVDDGDDAVEVVVIAPRSAALKKLGDLEINNIKK